MVNQFLEHHNLQNHQFINLFISFFNKLIDKNHNELTNVVDFLKAPTIKTYNSENKTFNIQEYHSLPIEKLIIKQQKYNKKISDLLLNTTDFKTSLSEGEEIIYNLSDSYSVVKLTSETAFQRESALMQHCVGQKGMNYFDRYKCGDIEIWSIRDQNNKPHITIEYDLKKQEITQIQGKNNKPPIEKYKTFIAELIQNYNIYINLYYLKYMNIYCLGKKVFTNKSKYLDQLRYCHDNQDWSICDKNTIIFADNLNWFKIAPDCEVDEFYASFSNLEIYPNNFKAKVVNQSGCKNSKNAPNCKVKKFKANHSGLETYPENFKANIVDQSYCENSKIAPNCEVKEFYAINSGLKIYPEYFYADMVDQSYCENSKIAPNCVVKKFNANHSGLESYPENFKANHVDQSGCENAKIAPNCDLKEFNANTSGLKTYPDKFKADYVSQSFCKHAKIAPNCEVKEFIATSSGLENYPENFKCDNIVI